MNHRRINLLSFILALVGAVGCSSLPKGAGFPPPTEPGKEVIDLVGLSRDLGMDRPRESLGYDEKRFNSCDAGNGYSSTHSCRDRILSVVNLKLECRDSMGTTSNAYHKLAPISSQRVEWDWAGRQSLTATDRDGYARVLLISSRSPKNQRLRLTINNKFLAMTASEMHRVVVPRDWCTR